MRLALLLTAVLVLTGASWIDPHAKAREASRLYEKGDFEAATQKYNEALTDDPDSHLLQYNRGASLYRENKFADAAAAFGRTPIADPSAPAAAAEIAYNIGNAKYRLGVAAAESDPQNALGLYAEALAAYRRAMGANPDDLDAKFNYELVERKLEELKQRLEEQQQEQEKKQRDQQQEDQQQNQQQDQQQQAQPEQQPQDQQEADQQQQQAEQQDSGEQEEAGQPQPQPQDSADGEGATQQQQAESAVGGERREGEMSEREAHALLDAARDQEVRPDEIIERMQGAAVLEPSEDW
jgi:Ca-activated chloride channel family protein